LGAEDPAKLHLITLDPNGGIIPSSKPEVGKYLSAKIPLEDLGQP